MPRFSKALKTFMVMAGMLSLASVCRATDVAYSGPFIGVEGTAVSSGSAISTNFTRNMNQTGNLVALQVVTSTYTIAVSTNFGSNNYTVNTPTITVTSNKFTTGLQVLYSVGASPAITGLTDQTTYFISVLNPNTLGQSNTFKLSSSLVNAQAGTGIVLASSSTSTNRYTLAPLAFTNTTQGGIQLQTSLDGMNYSNVTVGNYGLAITSVTYAAAGGSVIYDLGPIQWKYLRIKSTPPTTGGMNFTVTTNERYSTTH